MTIGRLNWLVVAIRYFGNGRTGMLTTNSTWAPPSYDLLNLFANYSDPNMTMTNKNSASCVDGVGGVYTCDVNHGLGKEWAIVQVCVYFLVGVSSVVYVLFNLLTAYVCDIEVSRAVPP